MSAVNDDEPCVYATDILEGFDPEKFDRALRIYGDPWIAAICAMPPQLADKGHIEYRRTTP